MFIKETEAFVPKDDAVAVPILKVGTATVGPIVPCKSWGPAGLGVPNQQYLL